MSLMNLQIEVAISFILVFLGMVMATSLRSWLWQNSKCFATSSICSSWSRFVACILPFRQKIPLQIIVGLDCGGVILAEDHGEHMPREVALPAAESDSNSFCYGKEEEDRIIRHFLQVPMIPGVIDAVTKLVQNLGSQNVYLVSKCGPRMEQKIRAWFKHKQFFELTGTSPDNLIFVRERKDKAPVCEKLGVTHFVDNHLEVLEPMQQLGIRSILFAPQEHELNTWYDRCKAGGKHTLESPFDLVWNWSDANRAVLGSSSSSCASEVNGKGGAPAAEKSKSQPPKAAAQKLRSSPSSYHKATAPNGSSSKVWSCPACTLENKDYIVVCEACGGQKPDSWECQTCTLTNSSASHMCVACYTRRDCTLTSRQS